MKQQIFLVTTPHIIRGLKTRIKYNNIMILFSIISIAFFSVQDIFYFILMILTRKFHHCFYPFLLDKKNEI